MTTPELNALKRGDIVQHVSGGPTFIVDANYGGRVTAVATADLTNPAEWKVVKPIPIHHPEFGERHPDKVKWITESTP